MAVALVLAALLGSMATAGAGGDPAGDRPEHPRGGDITVRFELLENQFQGADRFRAELVLTNHGRVALAERGWAMYFNFGRSIRPESLPPGIAVAHLNGDLWRLTVAGLSEPVAPGGRLRIPFDGSGSVIKRTEAPAGLYLAFEGEPTDRAESVGEYTIAPFTEPSQTRRAADDRVPVPTAASLYESNQALTLLPPERVGRILPTPLRAVPGPGSVTLDPSWRIEFAPGLEREMSYLVEALVSSVGVLVATAADPHPEPGVVTLAVGTLPVAGSPREPGDEAYRLSVSSETGIEIVGSDPAGVFYGVQSLRALLPPADGAAPSGAVTLAEVTVEDAPRFVYRGLHLDVARNFHPRETVEKLLDLAAFYKLNRFHFHLTDDEGWRLPVAALPELTSVGGRRGHTADERDRLMPSFGSGPDPDPATSHGSGHYTREDLVAILRHARDRHLRVIPEIDVPGHARAAIRAMAARRARLLEEGRASEAEAFLLAHPEDRSEYRSVQDWDDNVIDVCMPSTYRFLETVIDEIVSIWAEAGMPLEEVHIGGDEVPAGVWQGSPACRRMLRDDPQLADTSDLWYHFLRRLSALLAERGLATAGWEEIGLTAGAHGTKKAPSEEFLDRDVRPWVWNNVWGDGAEDIGYRLANAGYRVVLANATNLYFDLAYDKHPEEPGYIWAGFVDTRAAWEFAPLDLYRSARADRMGNPIDPDTAFAGRARLTAEGRRRVHGIQGQLWSENIKGRALLEYLAFPKLLALAERAWAAQPEWARTGEAAERERLEAAAWNEFANRLGQRELPRLDRLHGGVLYRLPPPGAVVRDGLLRANTAFPGLAIRYTTDGSEPTASSPLYEGPVAVGGDVQLRSFDTRGRGSRSSVVTPGG